MNPERDLSSPTPSTRSAPTRSGQHRRWWLAATLTAIAVGSTVACGGPDEQTAASQTQPAAPPEELAQFYDQHLSWEACESYATTSVEKPYYVAPFECARLRVPLDYRKPDARTASIGVMRLKAKGDRIGSLVLNPGGPGGSGMTQAAITSVNLKDTEIPQRFDVVGFDPRGVGASTPAISCFTDDQRDRGDDQATSLGTAGIWTPQRTRALTDECAKRSGGPESLSAVGSRDTARDLDILRAALGEQKLTFSGQSYGTRLGAVYAEMFPHNLRAMVLDGAIDPQLGTAERRVILHRGFQRSFDLMAASCARDPQCPLGTDPTAATGVFQQLVRPLLQNPVPASDGREVGFNQATGGVTTGLYYSEQWPAIIDAISQLKSTGRGDKLLALSDALGVRGPDGDWNNQLDANFAINCNDEQRRTPAQEADLRRQVFHASPFMDPGLPVGESSRDACENWPTPPTLGIPYAQDIDTDSLPRTMVISVTGDPVTPYDSGKRLAEDLDATMLTVKGERHTVAQGGVSACVNRAFARYLIDLDLPSETKTCTL